ncbi:hypothetical protein ALC60_09152 [Trachymyrmex zeteki]|uniref:GIY-YIG domain-containing protein n=1 Tax=Mycetomoellerius zeteki TaxID=64791 RepID=A0A151WVE3_9HYME|nr:hypothetical protein ALC60_09152 [Trachymyrmex zeteki]
MCHCKLAFSIPNSLNKFIKKGKYQLDPLFNQNVVYKISCDDCEASYVGQTKRQLKTRLHEHVSDINKKSKSPTVITCHRIDQNHNFDWDNVEILLISRFLQLANHVSTVLINNSILGSAKIVFLATLLDPCYKKMHFQNIVAVSYAQTKVNKLLKEILAKNYIGLPKISFGLPCLCTKITSVWNIHDELMTSRSENLDEFGENGGMPAEFRQYLISLVADRRECPLKTWQLLRILYPHLYKIALEYLVIVGTSVPCERLFSKAGDIITEKRNRLKGKRASKIIFLSSLNKEYW